MRDDMLCFECKVGDTSSSSREDPVVVAHEQGTWSWRTKLVDTWTDVILRGLTPLFTEEDTDLNGQRARITEELSMKQLARSLEMVPVPAAFTTKRGPVHPYGDHDSSPVKERLLDVLVPLDASGFDGAATERALRHTRSSSLAEKLLAPSFKHKFQATVTVPGKGRYPLALVEGSVAESLRHFLRSQHRAKVKSVLEKYVPRDALPPMEWINHPAFPCTDELVVLERRLTLKKAMYVVSDPHWSDSKPVQIFLDDTFAKLPAVRHALLSLTSGQESGSGILSLEDAQYFTFELDHIITNSGGDEGCLEDGSLAGHALQEEELKLLAFQTNVLLRENVLGEVSELHQAKTLTNTMHPTSLVSRNNHDSAFLRNLMVDLCVCEPFVEREQDLHRGRLTVDRPALPATLSLLGLSDDSLLKQVAIEPTPVQCLPILRDLLHNIATIPLNRCASEPFNEMLAYIGQALQIPPTGETLCGAESGPIREPAAILLRDVVFVGEGGRRTPSPTSLLQSRGQRLAKSLVVGKRILDFQPTVNAHSSVEIFKRSVQPEASLCTGLVHVPGGLSWNASRLVALRRIEAAQGKVQTRPTLLYPRTESRFKVGPSLVISNSKNRKGVHNDLAAPGCARFFDPLLRTTAAGELGPSQTSFFNTTSTVHHAVLGTFTVTENCSNSTRRFLLAECLSASRDPSQENNRALILQCGYFRSNGNEDVEALHRCRASLETYRKRHRSTLTTTATPQHGYDLNAELFRQTLDLAVPLSQLLIFY